MPARGLSLFLSPVHDHDHDPLLGGCLEWCGGKVDGGGGGGVVVGGGNGGCEMACVKDRMGQGWW